jgi:hypothetical protein
MLHQQGGFSFRRSSDDGTQGPGQMSLGFFDDNAHTPRLVDD